MEMDSKNKNKNKLNKSLLSLSKNDKEKYKNKDKYDDKFKDRLYSDDFFSTKNDKNENQINNLKSKEINNNNNTNLNKARFYILLCSICFCIGDVTLKLAFTFIPGFNFFLILTFRFIFFFIVTLIFIYKKNIKIQEGLFKVKEKNWLLIRILANIFGVLFFRFTFDHIRLGLSNSVLMIYPLLGNFFSIYFFNEKFEMKYIISCLVSIFGTYLIGIGEKNKGENIKEINGNTFIGIIFGFIAALLLMLNTMASKALGKSYNSYELCLLVSFYSIFASFFFSCFDYGNLVNNLSFKFIFFSMIMGISNFGANYFSIRAFQLAPFNKISYINYSQIVFNLIAGCFIFGENLQYTDFIGSFLIISYNYFTTLYHT
jgi:drug/metabolite transporter (DMT)-like permease